MRPLKTSEIRAIAFLGLSVLLTYLYQVMSSAPSVTVVSGETPAILERRLLRARQTAATVPERAKILKSVRDQLQTREKGVMNFTTAPQAQAHLLEVVRRIATGDKIEFRGGDFSPPLLLDADYGQVLVTINFECTIDEYLNFLSDLSKEAESIAPAEIHIGPGNPKIKTINVRMTVAAVVPKKLVPEKKGFGASL